MDTKIKLDIENVLKAINFLGIAYPYLKPKINYLKQLEDHLRKNNILNTEQGLNTLLDTYRKITLPNIDIVLSVTNIINAANNLEKNNKLYFDRKEKFRKKIQELIGKGELFANEGYWKLIKYWRVLGLPELSNAIKKDANETSSVQKHANKIGDLSYKNLDPQYVKNIPDHLKKIVLDQINTLEELSGLTIKLNNPSTSDITNYNIIPHSIQEYVKKTLENLSKITKSRVVLI